MIYIRGPPPCVQCTHIAASRASKFAVTLDWRGVDARWIYAIDICEYFWIYFRFVQNEQASPDPRCIDALSSSLVFRQCKWSAIIIFLSQKCVSYLPGSIFLWSPWILLNQKYFSHRNARATGAFFFDLHKYCWIKNIIFSLPQKCESYVAREQAKLTRENACAVLFDENCCKVEGFFFFLEGWKWWQYSKNF